jgi:hypothetical protein
MGSARFKSRLSARVCASYGKDGVEAASNPSTKLAEIFGAARRTRGNPQATGPAILKVVDADRPPLRIFFGAGPLEMIKVEYEKRIAEWEKWNDVSVAAHGKPEKT